MAVFIVANNGTEIMRAESMCVYVLQDGTASELPIKAGEG